MTYQGQSLRRFEDSKLLTGDGCFVDDITLPDMLHAAVLRSPHAHAAIRSVDSALASRLPGVVYVITGEDIAGVLKDIPTRTIVAEQAVEGMKIPEHPLLAKGRVCYAGQTVAIVVAHNACVAEDALESIRVDYEPLPPLLDPRAASREDAPIVHRELGTNVAIRVCQQGGDLKAAFARADHVISQSYEAQRLSPVPLETRGVIAQYSPQEDLLTIWNSTQAPHRLRSYLSLLLDMPEATLRVIAPDVGGSFGVKDCIFPEDVLVPYLSLHLKRSIKWVEDRQEDMLAYHGRGQSLDMEVAVTREGEILGMRVSILADLGAYFLLTTPSAPLNICRRITGPYRIPALRVELQGVVTNKTPTGAYRGTGGPEAAVCMERTIDLIAGDLGLDPAVVRRRNFIPSDAFPYQTSTGITYDSGNYEEGLDRALELINYSEWRGSASVRPPGESLIGVGLATVVKASGASGDHRVESTRVRIEPSGQITVFTGISPHGQGSATSFAQIVADQLGVSPAQVQVLHGDTGIFPSGEGTNASRGLIVGGSALFAVLQMARQKLAIIASELLGRPAKDIGFQDGKVFDRKKPGGGVNFVQVANAAYDGELLPLEVEAGLDFTGTYTLSGNPYSFAAHAVVVEVDRDTGDVKILRYAGVHDCGRLINPALVAGQIHGGTAQGIGQALTESIIYDDEGQLLTGSLLDYAVLNAEMMPDMVLDTIVTPSPTNPLGAKGIGSVATVPAPAAVANAVLNALTGLGVRHIDSPLTSEKVWRAIQQASAKDGV